MEYPVLFWVGFHLLVFALLLIDLKGFHRKSHELSRKEALVMSAMWILLALGFNLFIYLSLGAEAGLQFLTGYVIEKSLSVDNLFVFLLIFSYFNIAPKVQHRVLYWGILGAIAFRIVLILAGVKLIQEFHWVTYLLGALLIGTGIKFALETEQKIHPERNVLVRLAKMVFPLSSRKGAETFFVRQRGKWMMTSLFVVVLTIESADIIFALDSIPAILAITTDPFIVYTSNIFAILGLRSLYFVLSGYIDKLRFFKYGLAAILVFIGAKMVLAEIYPIPLLLSLGIISAILALTITCSLIYPVRSKKH
jgi:tellurite resistance protein TerC